MKGHIRKRGNSWELKFDAGRDAAGRRNIRYVTVKGGTKRRAQAKLAELLAAFGNGSFVEPSKLTVAAFVRTRVDQWEAAGDISARTAQRYRQLVEHQIAPHIGGIPLQRLKPLDVEDWHNTLRNGGRVRGSGGLAVRTIRHAHRVLGKALRDAARNELVARNVASGQSAPRLNDDEEVVIVRDVPALIRQLAGWRYRTVALVALFTGMRLGEVLALRWDRVDLDRKLIQVREALEQTKAHGLRFKRPKTKTGRRNITLPTMLVSVLREHRKAMLEQALQLGMGKLADDALLFAGANGGPLSPNAVSAAWAHFADSIGQPAVTFHALRHTHASQLIDAHVDIVTISKRLGHAKPDTTLRVYAHLYQKDDGKAATAINTTLGGA
jgi:integrase